MLRPEAATISSAVNNRISEIQSTATRYLDCKSFEVKSLFFEANKLVKVDPVAGHVAIAAINQLVGDLAKTRYHINNAFRLGGDIQTHGSAAAFEVNLGCFSQGQKHYAEIGNPEAGFFSKSFSIGLTSGAFACMSQFLDIAEKMKIDTSALPVETVRRANAVLSKAGVSDEAFARVLDLAGEVLRAEQVFYAHDCPFIYVDDETTDSPQRVYLSYKIALPGQQVSEMSSLLFEKIATQLEFIPEAFHVSFSPV